MAASPISIAPAASARPNGRRRPLILTARRLQANRRNAARSTGPRTPKGKARVARNAIKHGFFAAPQRWSEVQQRDFEEMLAGLREEFQPRDAIQNGCVVTIAASYVRMAALWHYENIAAVRHHEECERALNECIAAASPDEAERLTAEREELRRAGLWRPTIPNARDGAAICRYQGRLDRAIRDATASLEGMRAVRRTFHSKSDKIENAKTNPLRAPASGGPEAPRRTSNGAVVASESEKTNCHETSSSGILSALRRTSNAIFEASKGAKTNPLSSMFMGNRHQRRRARAMARRRT